MHPQGTSDSQDAGKVTVLGALAVLFGQEANGLPIAGWVRRDGNESPRIDLVINGRKVLSTFGAPTAGTLEAEFSFRCDELAEYLGDGDIISVEYDGSPLEISGSKQGLPVTSKEESRTDDLFRKLGEGYSFNKFGKLTAPLGAKHTVQSLSLFGEIVDLLRERFSLDVFPAYGSLLGIVRDGALLEYDSKGFDAFYLSRKDTPEELHKEFKDICLCLIDEGYFLNPNRDGVYIRSAFHRDIFIDLHFSWFADDKLQISYGWYHEEAVGRDRFLAQREIEIAGRPVRVPGNAEHVLEQVYGTGWSVPDQGFTHDEIRRIRPEQFLVPYDLLLDVYKRNVNRNRARLQSLEVRCRDQHEKLEAVRKYLQFSSGGPIRRGLIRVAFAVRNLFRRR